MGRTKKILKAALAVALSLSTSSAAPAEGYLYFFRGKPALIVLGQDAPQTPGVATLSLGVPGPATVGTSYSLPMSVSGGPVSTYRLTNPVPGLSVSASGLSGTPSTPGTYPVAVEALNSGGNVIGTSHTRTVEVRNPVTVPAPAAASYAGGSSFPGLSVSASGGDGSYTYGISNAPSWLTINASSGQLTSQVANLPETPPTSVTLRAQDSAGRSGTATWSVRVYAPVTVAGPGNITIAQGSAFPGGTVTASGGTGSYTYSLSGAPSWLAVDAASGALTSQVAQPPATPSTTVTARAQDSGGASSQTIFTVEVTPAPVVAGAPSNVSINEGAAFPGGMITASGGNGSFSYSLVGAPSWLSVNPSTGALSASPSNPPATALTTVTARVQDSSGASDQKTFTVEVKAVAVLTLATPGAATVGQPLSVGMTASGSSAASYRLAPAVPGLTASASGVSGTPTSAGSYPLTVEALNGSGEVIGTSNTENLHVHAPVVASAPANVSINEGTAFPGRSITATGGNGSLTYSLSGAPAWLTVNPSAGTLSSSPLNPPVTPLTTVTARAQDSAGRSDAKTFTVEVRGVATLTLAAPGAATVGSFYSISMTRSGTTPSSYRLKNAVPWLTASGTGVSGTPTTAGSYSVAVEALDASSNVIGTSNTVTVDVRNAVTVAAISSVSINEGTAFPARTVSASGGNGSFTYAISGGPAWLAVNSSTGALSATTSPPPITPVTTVTARATDSAGRTNTRTFTVEVKAYTSMTLAAPGSATVNSAYSISMTRSGTTPSSYRLTTAVPGLSASASGISGTPTTAGTYSVAVEALNSSSVVIGTSNTVTVNVRNTVSVAAISNVSIYTGTAFPSRTVSASGGNGTFTYSLSGAPAWLSVNSSTGAMSSSPANPPNTALTTVTARATDGEGRTNTTTFTVEVSSQVATAFALGLEKSCALTQSGAARCWGQAGSQGDGLGSPSVPPVYPTGLSSGVSNIGDGENHTCVVTTAGAVKCWGYGEAIGQATNRATPTDVPGLSSGVLQVGGGRWHSCALMSTGGVMCWGDNQYAQLGNGTTTDSLTPVNVTGVSNAVQLAVGDNHACVRTSVGGVKCWGYDPSGQTGTSTSNRTNKTSAADVIGLTSGVASIDAGGDISCAVMTTGGLKCWGANASGQLGTGTSGGYNATPQDVSGLSSGVASVTVGGNHVCARMTSGGMKCWGSNYYGQLGNGTTTSQASPIDIPGFASGVTAIGAGQHHSCVALSSGAVKCVGYNYSGQIGDGASGSSAHKSTPVNVIGW